MLGLFLPFCYCEGQCYEHLCIGSVVFAFGSLLAVVRLSFPVFTGKGAQGFHSQLRIRGTCHLTAGDDHPDDLAKLSLLGSTVKSLFSLL